jgi:hypothetical protein
MSCEPKYQVQIPQNARSELPADWQVTVGGIISEAMFGHCTPNKKDRKIQNGVQPQARRGETSAGELFATHIAESCTPFKNQYQRQDIKTINSGSIC